MIKKIIYLFCIPLIYSCNLDVFPNDAMTQETLVKEKEGAESATLGNYAMFKEVLYFEGAASVSNTYVRHYFQLAEFPGDNTTLSGVTSDPLSMAANYQHVDNMRNVSYLWWVSYKIIYGTNVAIESIPEGRSAETDQLKGENYFLRALLHFNLVRFFAKPYIQGRDNLGIVIRTSSKSSKPERAKVGDVYDRIISDLEESIRLMNTDRGPQFASKAAAWALLSRVYLYMNENEKVIESANEVFKLRPISKLEPESTYPNYFKNALNSTETLFAVMHTPADSRGQASIASMYLTDGTGWGEIYASIPYRILLDRNKNDLRHRFLLPQYKESNPSERKMAIYYGEKNTEGNNLLETSIPVTFNTSLEKYEFMENGIKKYVEKDEYNVYYVYVGGKRQNVLLDYEMDNRYTYSKCFVTKFSYQDDDPMLSSPVMLRLSEVVLNRAEAYAKLNENSKALEDVNTIRSRAGLSGKQLFSESNMLGYTSVETIVLDERRLELAFEGHRAFDVFRNNNSLDRNFPGIHPAVIIEPTNPRIIYFIPQNEILSSGIPQNK